MPHNGWGKVLIGTRLEKVVSSRFFQVWERIITTGLRPGDACYSVRGMVAHQASNKLVRVLLASECDSLLFLDSDAVADHDIIRQFCEYEDGFEYDILQAFYTRRGWPPAPIWLKKNALGQVAEYFVMRDNHHEPLAVAGTHSCIVRREVFETMLGDNDPEDFDWFYYPRGRFVSEDSAFSADAELAGFKVGGTTAIKVGHLGELETSWETYMDYLSKTGRVSLMVRYRKTGEMISAFLDEDMDLVLAKSMESEKRIADAWREKAPETPDEVRAFYGDKDNQYLYNLLEWNCQPLYARLILPLSDVHGEKALVIGAGIGTECAVLLKYGNEVHAVELPGILSDFLQHRFGDQVKLMDQIPDEQYDVISMIDVAEHVHPSEIQEFLGFVDRALAPGGKLVAHYTDARNDVLPQHFDNDEAWEEWVSKYRRVGESLWIKETA